MRFKKRLGAAVLAVMLAVSSVQLPGGISYAAEMPKSTAETAEDVTEPVVEDALEEGASSEAGSSTETESGGSVSTAEETQSSDAEADGGTSVERTEETTRTEEVTEETTQSQVTEETVSETVTEETTETETETETKTETETEETAETETGLDADLETNFPEYPNAEIPFEIDGDDIFAGLDELAAYSARISASDPKYDPREAAPDEVTSVKNQNPYGTCWAFATMEIMQNSMIRNGLADNNVDLSERQLAYFAYHTGYDALGNANDDTIDSEPDNTWLQRGGNALTAAVKLMNWHGGASESKYPYSTDALERNNAQDKEAVAHDIYFVPTKTATTEERKRAVKNLICRYGSVFWSYFDNRSYYNYNKDSCAYYYDGTGTNHAITIVGWDDDFSASNFKADKRPRSDGAWLVKNSWGPGWGGDGGYFYISYEDKSLGSGNSAAVAVAAPKDEYDNNYFHGNTSFQGVRNLSTNTKIAQVFTAKGDEELRAVSIMLSSDKIQYSVQVYKNPELTDGGVKNPDTGERMLTDPVTGTTGYAGLYTIDLGNPVELSKDDRFAIVIELKNTDIAEKTSIYTDQSNVTAKDGYNIIDKNTTHSGQSFWFGNKKWNDVNSSGYNFRVNALTKDRDGGSSGGTDTERYEIIYKLNGGTNANGNPLTYTVDTGTISFQPATRVGYDFNGWYKDVECTKPVMRIVSGSTGDITLYAKWDIVNYQIIYKLNGGTNADSNPWTYTVDTGTISFQPATRVGYDFNGWYKDVECTKPVMRIVSGSTGDITLYAKWDVVNYQIKYELGGGTNAIGNPTKYTIETETISLQPATMKDYYFDGWYSDSGYTDEVTEIPNGSTGDITLYAKWSEFAVRLEGGPFVYKGTEWKPRVTVTDGVDLVRNIDYQLTYENNINVGMAKVTVTGIGSYSGQRAEKVFAINKAPLTITARDRQIRVGASLPPPYGYYIEGLKGGDRLAKEPEFVCDIENTDTEGEYTITVRDADAGPNYSVEYKTGTLRVAAEQISCKVIFDTLGKGVFPAILGDVKVGSVIDAPKEPEADGYRFDGWYKDALCMQKWDFAMDIVQADMTLYAKWLKTGDDGESGGFAVQEIADQRYKGSAIKPAVSVYYGERLLKAGRDYQLRYYYNTNAGEWTDEAAAKARLGARDNVNAAKPELPYVEIIGMGGYSGTLIESFNILPANLGDGGAALGVKENLTKSTKPQKPFTSLKYGGRTLKVDKDFAITMEEVDARDGDGSDVISQELAGGIIPAGYTGVFKLTVTGVGNYTGSVSKNIYVADNAHLMSKAVITLGRDLKKIPYAKDRPVVLTSASEVTAENKNRVFTVKFGNKVLEEGKDYEVGYERNDRVGKAVLIVTGKNDAGYYGLKTATFEIVGKKFSASTVKVENLENKTYTGKALTQNSDTLLTYNKGKPDETLLQYGTDYTVSYSKNIGRGTSTVTFTGKNEAGYSGKFSKTFKIDAEDIENTVQVMRGKAAGSIVMPYSKAGAKPVDEIALVNEVGIRLVLGKDYTLSYKNNKAVAAVDAEKPPTVTVTGRGNYKGRIDVPFTIEPADLRAGRENGSIAMECAAVAYNAKKTDSYEYRPRITIKDGKTALREGKDYEIVAYKRNTQADYVKYLAKFESGAATDDDRPVAVIRAKAGADYDLDGSIELPLRIYKTNTKLKWENLQVEFVAGADVSYKGEQISPKVLVSYKGEQTTILLREGEHYTISYGGNVKAGKYAGRFVIRGLAPYSGSAAYMFHIERKGMQY